MPLASPINWKLRIAAILLALHIAADNGIAQDSDELAEKKSWKPTTQTDLQDAFKAWAEESKIGSAVSDQIHELVQSKFDESSNKIDLVMQGLAYAREDVARFVQTLSSQRTSTLAPDFTSLIENDQELPFLRSHVRLYYARWLAQNEFYDESLGLLDNMKVHEVLDPETLLFYRALMQHQLLKKDECVKTAAMLLEHAESLPRRYSVLSKLVLADIEPLEADSLDEVTRLMGDIRRRTGLHRSGKIVLKQEEAVIKKLDKLIEELEAQQQQQQSGGTNSPSSPMQDSQNAGGQGSGEVVGKRIQEGGEWGDLPPAERAAALAEMAKDMPPHYRAVIEEYFRQLAKDEENQ